jgi:hypothetical protein
LDLGKGRAGFKSKEAKPYNILYVACYSYSYFIRIYME